MATFSSKLLTIALALAFVKQTTAEEVVQVVKIAPIVPLEPETLGYASNITKNIFVKQIHSHNDYWRAIPLYTALSYGVQSVEADVWVMPEITDDILVGHSLVSLTNERTLDSLYIDQLVAILNSTNPVNEFTATSNDTHGVFDTDSTATLYFFIDFKTNGTEAFQKVYDAFEPLRSRGWLTTYDETTQEWTDGPITVIGTGDTPYDAVAALEQRDFFFDGPLGTLNDSYPYTINPIASASLKSLVGEVDTIDGLTDEQFYQLKSIIDEAHDLGVLTRIWEAPWWPKQKERNVWRQILKSGSDFLNADDLAYATTFY
ncbi:hypothetical protein CANARDRAFT_6758 [[Candida] arabinofermentans NRRL YB-2248]|uniref:Altered inheritance of mitochondria protein 6 n=1 Tax=[Candida] arabinofermentans NRRL YB-2248 TaxID=983967 RepID=A0A1E4T3F0_9ASCO|nr:hypothetical protein CANARDRAFT_6758 [[Candida] arabinofermentans NRRL YB-2248]